MDKSHRLDAPNNDSLKTIEQVDNRSELSTIYPHAHEEWGGEVMGQTEREEKREKEYASISLSIRSKFAAIGLLVPMPLVLFGLLAAVMLTYTTEDNAPILTFPAMFAAFFCGLLSFLAIKNVYKIFYDHALKATPFILILLFMLGFCIQSAYASMESTFIDSPITAVLITSAATLALSTALSGIILLIWTAPKLKSGAKIGCIVLISLLLASAAVGVSLL